MAIAGCSAPELVWDVRAELGEGPVWDAERACVWFVDIKGRKLHRHDPATGRNDSWDTPDQTGFALPADDGSLICGVRGGLHRFDPGTGRLEMILPVETDRPGNRLNDGFVDPEGGLWFGSMDDAEEARAGALYRWFGGVLERHDDGHGITNGPCLSPDGRTLYHHDTADRTIFAYDHEDGRISNRRPLAVPRNGYPDGPAADAEGMLWIGLFHGGGVGRFAPDGTELETLVFPVPTVTKVAFGGEDLRTVYATTAWKGLGAEARAAHPAAGGLFRFTVTTPGLAPNRIRL